MTQRRLMSLAVAIALFAAPAAQARHRGHHPEHAQPTAETVTLAKPETVGFDKDRLARLDAAMQREVDAGLVSGIVTMLVRHGKVVDFNAFGKKSIAAKTPMTRDTLFRIYSQTKPLTGVAMMMLFEEGKWRLDEPVTKYIPEFALLKVQTGVDAKGAPILEDVKHPPTMRELMTHTAGFGYGLRDTNPVDRAFRDQKVLSSNGLPQMIQKIAGIPLLAQPGTKWSYSVAADIQGYIVEKLSGQSLADFMQARIFKPLGMNDTFFAVPGDKASRLAAAYFQPPIGGLVEVPPGGPLQDFTKPPPLYSGGGGLVSTAEDYAKFCQMILNGGELNGVRLLAPATVALMEANHIESSVVAEPLLPNTPAIGGDALGFGLDFAVMSDPAKLGSLVGKGAVFWGGAAGTWFWIDPKNDLFFLGMIQRFSLGAAGSASLGAQSQTFVYSALTEPER
jgi:CubicO group peptidase (beta-lactamase class C family)